MRKLVVLAGLLALLILPGTVRSEPPAQAPAPQAPVSPPGPTDEIDWLSEFTHGDPENPEAVPPKGGAMGRSGRRHDYDDALDRMRKNDPERYKRLLKIRRLTHEYRHADSDKERAEIEKQLKPLVDQELRIQQENNKKRIVQMERRLADAKKVLDERDKNWDKVVDFTVKEITGQNAYLRATHRHEQRRQQRRR